MSAYSIKAEIRHPLVTLTLISLTYLSARYSLARVCYLRPLECMSPSLAFWGQFMSTEGALLADRRFHTEAWIHNSTAAGPRVASAGSRKPGCCQGWHATLGCLARSYPFHLPTLALGNHLVHPFPDLRAPGPPATHAPAREDQRGETCTVPRPVCCSLRSRHGSAERQLRPDTPGARGPSRLPRPGRTDERGWAGCRGRTHQTSPASPSIQGFHASRCRGTSTRGRAK